MGLRLLVDRKVWLLEGAGDADHALALELFDPARVIGGAEELARCLESDAPELVWRSSGATWAAGSPTADVIHAAAPQCCFVEELASAPPWLVAGPSVVEAAAVVGLALGRGQTVLGEAAETHRWHGALIQRLLERSNEAVALVDSEGRVLPGSPAVGRILGMRPERVIGRVGFDLMVDEDRARARQIFAHVLARPGEPVTFEGAYHHVDGGTRIVEHSLVNLLDDPEMKAVVINGRDVTELRELQADAQRRRELSELGRVVGRVAHDFNNLLAILRVNAEQVVDSPQERHLRDVGDVMLRAVDAGARLTQNLLAFGRLLVLEPKVIELGAWLHALRPELVEGVGREVRLSTAADAEQWARVDPTLLGDAVAALVQNAIDASGGQGPVELFVETWHAPPGARGVSGPLDPGPWRALRVRDAGEGMDAETQAHAAEPFFTTRGLRRGGGLGLSMVHGFAAQSGGDLCFESRAGEGSVVSILLPLSEAPTQELETPALQDSGGEFLQPCRPLGILLVEDEADLRATLRQYLELVGHQVFTAGSGREGIRVAVRELDAIDVVVTDVIMPGLGGVDLMKLLHEAGFDWPVIYVSGLAESFDLERIVLGDGVAFLRKPFGMNDLVQRLRQLTEDRLDGS